MNRFIDPAKQRLTELEERSYTVSVTMAVVRRIMEHEVSQSAAAVAFTAFLSIFPLVLAMLAIFSPLLTSDASQETLRDFFSDYMPQSLGLLEDNLESVQRLRGVLGVIGVLLLIWSASAIFAAMSSAFNRAWQMKSDRGFVKTKAIQLAMVFGAGTMLCVSIGSTALAELLGELLDLGDGSGAAFARFMLSMAVRIGAIGATFLAVLGLYAFLPPVRSSWSSLWRSALVAAVLFDAAKNIFIWYLANFADYGAVYGSLAAVISMLVWLQLSAQIIVSGAELCAELATRRRDS